MDESSRADPSNIVLLCPNCHTLTDKSPEDYPAGQLLEKKRARAEAVGRAGGEYVFSDRISAREAVQAILTRNHETFSTTGPDQEDGAIETQEAADRWREAVLGEIIPGNEVIVSIVEENPKLTTAEERETAEQLRLHTLDLVAKHRSGSIKAPAIRFPPKANELFS